jgi:hypothetical protein
MEFTTSRLALVGAVLLFGLFATPAYAQASRTWVSGVGDDASPCSRTAPCKTFAGAISKTLAGGEIDALDPGGFGAVTITKALTLDGGSGQVASILVSGTNAINISAGASDVVILRNLAIDGIVGTGTGGLNGVQFNSGAALRIEHVAIFGFSDIGVSFVPSGAAQLVMKDVSISNCATGGIQFKPALVSSLATLDNVHSDHNGYGLYADGGKAVMRNSQAANNTYGVLATQSQVEVENTALTGNTHGVYAEAGGIVYLANADLIGNAAGLQVIGNGQIISFGNNRNALNTTPGVPTSTASQQ